MVTTITEEKAAKKAMKNYKKAEAEILKLTAEMELQKSKVASEYSSDLEAQSRKLEEAKAIIQAYAEENRDNILPADAKSTALFGIKIGWRSSTPKLSVFKGFALSDVIALLKEKAPNFIQRTESPDKKAIVKALDENGKLEGMRLKALGLQLTREEKFYID